MIYVIDHNDSFTHNVVHQFSLFDEVECDNYNEIYKFLLTPKNYRNKISQIDLNFTYNFDQKTAELKDIKVDNKINQNVNKILNNVILKKDNLQNKIYFKNLLNQAIKNYFG